MEVIELDKPIVVRKTLIKTNYFRFRCHIPILKYKVNVEPTIPSNQVGLFFRILNQIRPDLDQLLGTYQPLPFVIYSPNQCDERVFVREFENVRYSIKIEPLGILDLSQEDKEGLSFMGRFFKILQSSLKLKQIGRRYFNPENPTEFPKWKLSIWPGFLTSLTHHQRQVLINIDTSCKVVRETTIYEYIVDLMSKYRGDQDKIKDELIGTSVMTRYNNAIYRIDDIDFQLTPKCKFQVQPDQEISYAEYYENKYNRKLRYPDQPLLIHIKKKDSYMIHLVPELCVMTGQSPEMRANFQLQKDINMVVRPSPQKRLAESQKLLELLHKNDKTLQMLKQWAIDIEIEPLKVEGNKISAGNIIMGKNNQFPLEDTPDFDRRIQSEMLEQPKITKIGIFMSKRDQQAAQVFLDMLKQCVTKFNYPMQKPREFIIEGHDFQDWEESFRKNLDTSVQAVILILPESKRNNTALYNACKHFLIKTCPIPSQAVLASTITAGKNLRSIVNKILIQLCAKVGGTPWSISDLPFVDKPTMLVGIDVFNRMKDRKSSILSYVATVNNKFSRYWSTIEPQNSEDEVTQNLQVIARNSILAFKETNRGTAPARIIVYRDGIAESYRKTIKEMEVKAFLRAFEDLIQENQMTVKPEFIYICVNRKQSVKLFYGDNLTKGVVNPEQGTVVSDEITTGRDFYLISQKSPQGTVIPIYYFVVGYFTTYKGEYVEIGGDLPEDLFENLQSLSYKLCFMYFNFSGAIAAPAPVQNAHQLSHFIGERWNPRNPMIPHLNFEKYKSLYFL